MNEDVKKNIYLSTSLVNAASKKAKVDIRSTSQQIEYWARLGQAAEENSDLSVPFYKKIVSKLEKIDDNAI